MTVIAVANQKGGVAKTTTAGAIASILAASGYAVLAVDTDPQANLTDNFDVEPSEAGTYAVLKSSADTYVRSLAKRSGNLDVLSATITLAAIEQEMSGVMGKEYKLKEALETPDVSESYDFVVIDTPPALGTLTVNALVAADYVVIPTMADVNATKGISQLNDTVRNVRKYFNPGLKIAGILLTRFDPRLNISKKVKENAIKAAEVMGTKLYGTHIRASVAAPEANYLRTDLLEYSPDSTVAQDYQSFMEKLIQDIHC